MTRKPVPAGGLRGVAAGGLAVAACVCAAAFGPVDAVSSPVRLASAVSSLNPTDGGPGGSLGDSGGDVAPAPGRSRASGGSSGGEFSGVPAVSHRGPAKSDAPGSGLQPDRVLPRPLRPSSGGGGGAAAPISAAAPETGGVGSWLSKALSMVGSLIGGGPTEKPGKSPAANFSSSGGDAQAVTAEPGTKPSPMGTSKGQVKEAPTPESVIRNVQTGVDKLIGSVVNGKPTD